jgi:hypothetical protein
MTEIHLTNIKPYKMRLLLSQLSLDVFLLALLSGCQKTHTALSQSSGIIQDAQIYFNNTISAESKSANAKNYRANLPRLPDWSLATTSHLNESDVTIVPIVYSKGIYASNSLHPELAYSLSDLTTLLLLRDSNRQFHAIVMTFFPDSAYSTAGTYFLEDWQGNSLVTPIHLGSNSTSGTTEKAAVEPDVVQSIQVCNEIDGYNYSPDDPSGGVAWSESSCNTYSISQQTTGPGLPPIGLPRLASTRVPLAEIVIAPPTNPIGNVQDYFKCFTNVGGSDHQYSVMLCVDQPDPGSRVPWGFSNGASGTSQAGNPVDVGHTFLVFTETYGGTTITRNVGFYPASNVNPIYPSDQGQLNDNESSIYDISLTVTVDDGQFFNMLNFVTQGNNSGYLYNMNTNNCTTFALDALQAGSVNIPTKTGSWAGGSGDDPGDLGEDLRSMSLQSNMTRNTVDNPHPNTGSCN